MTRMVMYSRFMARRPHLHVQSHGFGPSLVLLHANGGDGRDFETVIPDLVESGWRDHSRLARPRSDAPNGFGDRHRLR